MGGAATEFSLNGDTITSFNAARGFVGGAARKNRRSQKGHMRVSMPHAALWVVQRARERFSSRITVSMPHAALWGVQQ